MLLLIYMANLEPYIGVGEGIWRIAEDAIEALEGFVVFALLFVDDAKTE